MTSPLSHHERALGRGFGTRRERLLGLIASLRPGEGRCVALFFSYAFLLLVCYYVLKTLREPLLLVSGTAALKSYASAVVALVLLVLVPLYGFVFRRVAKTRVSTWTTLFFIACLGVFYAASRGGIPIGFAYYVFVGVLGVVLIAQFWAHAADCFGVESGQRLFPAIMAGATLGGLAGPLLVRAAYDSTHAGRLLLVGTALLVATLPLIGATRGSVPTASRSQETSCLRPFSHPLGGFALLLRDRYLMLVAALVVLLNCVNTTGEYLLAELVVEHVDAQVALDASLDKGALIAQFYAEILFTVNALTVAAQLFLVGRVFRRVGVQGALIAVPLVVLLGYLCVAFVPIFTVLRIIKVVENAADYSLTNTVRHVLYLPLSSASKYEGKIAIDTFFWRFGDLLQAGIVFAGLHWFGFEVRDFALLNLLLATVWLAVAIQLAKQYSTRAKLDAPTQDLGLRWRLPIPPLGRLIAARAAAGWLAVMLGIAGVTGSVPAETDFPHPPTRPGPVL